MQRSKRSKARAGEIGNYGGLASVDLDIEVDKAGNGFMEYSKSSKAKAKEIGRKGGYKSENLKIEVDRVVGERFMEDSKGGKAKIKNIKVKWEAENTAQKFYEGVPERL